MAQNFIPCDRDQALLLPPDLREWLPEGHLAWFVIETTRELDLSSFYADYRADGHGRAAHDPELMVAILLYAYASGVRSARAIERRCSEDVAFRVIAANRTPDHATFARFRSRHQERLAELFGQLLGLCSRAGIVSGELLALDSTKIAANASGLRNRTHRQIAEEILADAARIDAREDARYGAARGDELPEELADPTRRKAWIREQLEGAERPETEAPKAPGRNAHSERLSRLEEAKRRLEDEHEAKLAAEREHAAWRRRRKAELEAAGKRIGGRRPTKQPLGIEPGGRVNTTDLDSRPVKGPRGFIQGYNAQAVATAEQVIVSCELIATNRDQDQLEPMLDAARANLAAAGAAQPKAVLADAGYWSGRQIESIEGQGIEAFVPPDAHSRPRSGKGRRAGPGREAMRQKLDSESGARLYSRRQTIIEPVFAQTKIIRGAARFQRRGLAACRAEWRLIAATHNLLKLWRAAGPAQAA